MFSETAQKCFCGTAKCRGFIGGDKVVVLRDQQIIEELEDEKKEGKSRKERSKKDRFSDQVVWFIDLSCVCVY